MSGPSWTGRCGARRPPRRGADDLPASRADGQRPAATARERPGIGAFARHGPLATRTQGHEGGVPQRRLRGLHRPGGRGLDALVPHPHPRGRRVVPHDHRGDGRRPDRHGRFRRPSNGRGRSSAATALRGSWSPWSVSFANAVKPHRSRSFSRTWAAISVNAPATYRSPARCRSSRRRLRDRASPARRSHQARRLGGLRAGPRRSGNALGGARSLSGRPWSPSLGRPSPARALPGVVADRGRRPCHAPSR